jgi:hypothetical protein
MATAPAGTVSGRASMTPVASAPSRQWIVSPWVDFLLIILTPLISTPAVLLLYSSRVGVSAETISVVVAAFFALGHHLPGMMRAYGDRDLFARFHWRFLLAPPLLFLAYFPLYYYHYDLYRLIILVWATWHALMQLYGFTRIYDAKVGSVSTVTAYWDWLLCLCGFILPQLMRPEQIAVNLKQWYSLGGPPISAGLLEAVQWGGLAVFAIVLIGFCANYLIQCYRGPKPSSLKLFMLVTTIGLWWFAMTYVDNLLLGVALFDICHDIQYLAIVWLFNCRRVSVNPHLGRFLRYVFRRGMVLFYLGLITAYGAVGLVAPLVLDGTISRIFYAIMFTSTILHYYFDGFIWKVRETATTASLGIDSQNSDSPRLRPAKLRIPHLVKWSPAIVVLGFLFSGDLLNPPLTTSHKNRLEKIYAQTLLGSPTLPKDDEERSWIYAQYEQARIVADTVPQDRNAQLRFAILLANFGNNDDAVQRLEGLLANFPEDADALITLGGIHFYRGNADTALKNYLSALEKARTPRQRALANFKLGEHSWYSHDEHDAETRFAEALKDDPDLSSSIDFLHNRSRNQ